MTPDLLLQYFAFSNVVLSEEKMLDTLSFPSHMMFSRDIPTSDLHEKFKHMCICVHVYLNMGTF